MKYNPGDRFEVQSGLYKTLKIVSYDPMVLLYTVEIKHYQTGKTEIDKISEASLEKYYKLIKKGQVDATRKVEPGLYCNCTNPTLVTRAVLNQPYQYCTSCKKEKI